MEKLFNRAVLVDDDPISNFVTNKVVSKMDIAEEIVIKHNGREAFDYFKSQQFSSKRTVEKPDLVLLDISMAAMNGFELLEALHYTDYLENFRIVILSSSQSPKDIDEAAQYRIHGYLTKPLTAEKLEGIFDIHPQKNKNSH